MEIKRGDLYEAVWRQPRNQLAEKWSLSTRTITLACRQFDIPVPPSGHWTRVSMNKIIQRPPLRGDRKVSIELLEPTSNMITRRQPKHNSNLTAKPNPPSRPPNTGSSGLITTPRNPAATFVKATIQETSPAIRKAYRSYSSPNANRDYRYQHVLPGSESIVRIAVMPEMVERALLLMDAILRAIAAEKWAVQIPSDQDRTKNSVNIDGITVLFTLTEQRKQERIKSDKMWTDWEYRYHSTGVLRFQYGVGAYLSELKDKKNQSLEERIEDIVQALRTEVTRVQNSQIERREQERRYRLGQMLSGMVEQALKNNEKCEQRLDQCAKNHEQATKIRTFVEELKQRIPPDQWRTEQALWAEWALRRADELDPVTRFDRLDHTVPVKVLHQVQDMMAAAPERYVQLQELDLEKSVDQIIDRMTRFPKPPCLGGV